MARPPVVPVILCGGSGSRLWPLSRQSYPKQFSALLGDSTMFQDTVRRVSGGIFAAPILVTGNPFRFIVNEQVAALGMLPRAILIEPEARNTAPAALAGALQAAADDPDTLILLTPCDHLITDTEAFREAVSTGIGPATDGQIVTFGVRPTDPETGYGYLELAANADSTSSTPQPLAGFVEKPDAATAEAMLKGKRHLWNSGIFLVRAADLVTAAQRLAPDIANAAEEAFAGSEIDLGFCRLAPGPWSAAPNLSIDIAIMEQSDNLQVIPVDMGWSDLGEWNAVWRQSDPDDDGNVCSGEALALSCSNTLLRGQSEDQVLVGIGLRDIVAVAHKDAVLVAHRDAAQEVKQAVSILQDRGKRQATEFPRDYRPWGWFETLASGPRFQVKRIHVQPGAALSLQSHLHRAEHWVVVQGTARVTIDGSEEIVSENESIYVPLGAQHRLENPGRLPMVLIEVQTGAYLGEDDITRYDDIYARS